jgi:hypothetical protein
MLNDYTVIQLLFLVIAGIITGFINTLAGSGSVVSLGVLIWTGLPVNLANTTNRIGVLFQNVSGIVTFIQTRQFNIRSASLLSIIPTVIGAFVGGLVAVEISESALKAVVGGVMIFLLLGNFISLKSFVPQSITLVKNRWIVQIPIFFVIGFYGGFIQIGVGLLLLFALNLFSKGSLHSDNALKLFIVLLYTIPTTIFFILKDQIIWVPGLSLALGQIFGGILAGILSAKIKNSEVYVRQLIVLMIVLTLIRLIIY